MIRTTILAGILLVMLSMAYSRPGAMPSFGGRAVVEEQEAIQEEPVAEPSVRHVAPPRVAKKEEVAVPEEPEELSEPVEEPQLAEVAPQPMTPHALPAPVAERGRPISLLPPSMTPAPSAKIEPLVSEDMPAPPAPALPPAVAPVQEAAVLAPLPEVYVPALPVNAPQDIASRTMPDGKVAPVAAPQTEIRAPMVAAVGTKFMTPQERSRELYKLAREMEDTFIENMTK
ncbi:MAG: hypothetical protein AB7I36_16885 [Rhodospirillaceae bacterium]